MLKCNTVYLARYRSMKIPVSFRTAYARADKQILVDSGATDNFIHPRLIRRLALGTQKLERSRKIWNIDGTNNRASRITEYVDLSVQTGKNQGKMRFLITDLGQEDLILGYPWLATFEPKFSWADGTIDTVADDFGYVCLDKGKRKLVNVVDGFQAQRGDKSRTTLQTMMETAHSLWYPCAGN